jgi:hypothetical protein
MLPLLLLANGLLAPDPAPIMAAVAGCDRATMAVLAKAEPHRRAEFAVAAYDEQRAIAAERARLVMEPAGFVAPGQESWAPAQASLDFRQKRLDAARAAETAWRSTVEDLRADFLANCPTRK